MSLLVKAGGGAGGIAYTGDNPLTIGQNGYTFEPKTLLKNGLTIVNGVNGEDLTDVEARQALAVADLMRVAKRKVSEARNFGDFVWKKSKFIPYTAFCTSVDGSTWVFTIDSAEIDLTQYDDLSVLGEMKFGAIYNVTEVGITTEDGLTFKYYLRGEYKNDLTASWDKATKTLTLTGTCPTSADAWSNRYYDVEEHYTFIDYVVADDETSYPNGGELDGYYYELFSNPVDLADEPNWIEENIREGISMFGKIGTMLEGLDMSELGFTKMSVVEFSYSSNTKCTAEIEHKLGETPKFLAIITDSLSPLSNNDILYSALVYKQAETVTHNEFYCSGSNRTTQNTLFKMTVDDTKFYQYPASTTTYYGKGYKYKVVALA